MKLKRKNNKGFTLIEIIVVLVIMVIMAAIAIPAVTGYIKDAKNSKYVQETRSIYTIIQTEEAKAKALEKEVKYDATAASDTVVAKADLLATINDKMGDAKIDVSDITKTGEQYAITFTSDKEVKVTFTANKDDMKVEEVKGS